MVLTLRNAVSSRPGVVAADEILPLAVPTRQRDKNVDNADVSMAVPVS